MVRTRVGYAGGTSADVNYRNIGDWMEAIQIDYDPARVRYEDLLAIFFAEHDACEAVWKRQYASGIFFHDAAQKQAAASALAACATGAALRSNTESGAKPSTELAPVVFVAAEDYHQKYYLRQTRALVGELLPLFNGNESAFRESTAVARVNGYLAGNGTPADLERELSDLGLSADARDFLRRSHAANSK